MKMKQADDYVQLMRDHHKTKEAIDLLQKASFDPVEFRRLTENSNKIFDLVDELDAGQTNYDLKISNKWGTLDKLRKTTAVVDDTIGSQFSSLYGVDGIGLSTIEQVHSPLKSGKCSMR